ncbi:NADPH-dependent FMN reductase [Rhodobacterales bacterium 52_120_T64]|nr:NADPH-dependent FMN reductase [Rhodobacterales bacterium 52_120_T64]
MTSLLGISGSLRKESRNTALLHEAARLFAPDAFTMADIRFPLYDGDVEDSDGIPQIVDVLREQIIKADAVIISTPEYNGNISGVLKNALDWLSRGKPKPWEGKPVAIMSAAAGRSGGARTQFSLRNCMTPFNPRILQGPEVMIAAAGSAFGDNGQLINEFSIKSLTRLMDALRSEIR